MTFIKKCNIIYTTNIRSVMSLIKEDYLMQEDKAKALESALSKIEKDFGKGSVMKLGDQSKLNVETVPTGSLSLDIALGLGGIPKGRIVEVF